MTSVKIKGALESLSGDESDYSAMSELMESQVDTYYRYCREMSGLEVC